MHREQKDFPSVGRDSASFPTGDDAVIRTTDWEMGNEGPSRTEPRSRHDTGSSECEKRPEPEIDEPAPFAFPDQLLF